MSGFIYATVKNASDKCTHAQPGGTVQFQDLLVELSETRGQVCLQGIVAWQHIPISLFASTMRTLGASVCVGLANNFYRANKQSFHTILLVKRHLISHVRGPRMQPRWVAPLEAMTMDQMRTVNRQKHLAENLETFAGHCSTQTSLMNHSSLFPTDDRDGLLMAF